MASSPDKPRTAAPATVATSVDDEARRRAELERRARGGFYSAFRRRGPGRRDGSPSGAQQSGPGGDNQSVG